VTYQLRSHTITLDAALRDIQSRSPRERAMAAHALGDVLAPEDRTRAVSALIRALDDDRPEVRSEAALSLGDLETHAAVEPLIARIQDPVPAVRQSALIALGRLGFSSSFEAVAEALASGPSDVRFQAATSLAEIDPERAGAHLERALEDSDGEVIGAAAVALGAVGRASAADSLARLLETWETPHIRFDIAYALADLGDERAIDILAGFVDHKDLGWDAIEALGRSKSLRALEPLARVLTEGSVKSPNDLRAAAVILALIRARNEQPDQSEIPPEAEAAKAAEAAADRSPIGVTDLLPAESLAHVETRAQAKEIARTRLLAGLRARKLEHRGLAIQLLGEVGGAWAVDELRALRKRFRGRRQIDEIDAALRDIDARGP
jgi:HEAT repeat protein